MQADRPHDIRPITSDNPIRSDEIELTEKDAERLEGMTEDERHEELERMNLQRLQALEEAVHEPDPDPVAEKLYQDLKNALLTPPETTRERQKRVSKEKAKKKRRAREKAAKASKRKNR